MDIKKIEEALNKNFIKLGFLNKGIFNFVASKLNDNENLIFVCEGMTGTYPTAIVVTEDNLYISNATGMFSGFEFNTIPRKTITTINIETGMIFSTVEVFVGSVAHKLEKVASPFATKLREILLTKPPEKKEIQQTDPTDQIRKYKSLLDDGIISQEEFDKKKKEILGL